MMSTTLLFLLTRGIRSILFEEKISFAEESLQFSSFKLVQFLWQICSIESSRDLPDKILKNIQVNPKTFFLRSTTQNIKEKLKNNTNEAYEKGIFGAPTFLINNKIFWGQDRLEFVIKEASK